MLESRDEHIKFAKARAMEYVKINDYSQAITSLACDLSKHPETASHPAIKSSFLLQMGGKLNDAWSVTAFIEDVQ